MNLIMTYIVRLIRVLRLAKTRSYLLKKGVPFVERVPGHPRFREHVRANTLNHRIPQLELSDGTAIQDSVAIMDRLEEIYPEPSVYPPGLKQQTLARLFEVLVDGLLGRPAWHYRWNYMEENYGFVGREFGRSFKPQAPTKKSIISRDYRAAHGKQKIRDGCERRGSASF